MRVRRDNTQASAQELLAQFLVSESSPYRMVDGALSPWTPFVEEFRGWSGRQFPRDIIRAALPKRCPVARKSKGARFIGNVAKGFAAVKHYEAIDGYLQLVGGRPFTPTERYVMGKIAPVLDTRLVAFIAERCRREGSVDLTDFRGAIARYLELIEWWTTKQTCRQLNLAGFKIQDGRIIDLELVT